MVLFSQPSTSEDSQVLHLYEPQQLGYDRCVQGREREPWRQGFLAAHSQDTPLPGGGWGGEESRLPEAQRGGLVAVSSQADSRCSLACASLQAACLQLLEIKATF